MWKNESAAIAFLCLFYYKKTLNFSYLKFIFTKSKEDSKKSIKLGENGKIDSNLF